MVRTVDRIQGLGYLYLKMSSEFLATKAFGQLKQQQRLNHNLRELLKDETRNDRMFREFNGTTTPVACTLNP